MDAAQVILDEIFRLMQCNAVQCECNVSNKERNGMDCNAAQVILEIFRGNKALCANAAYVTDELVELFAAFVESDSSGDVTASPYLEFFTIICEFAHRRNQTLTLDVLTRRRDEPDDATSRYQCPLLSLRHCFARSFVLSSLVRSFVRSVVRSCALSRVVRFHMHRAHLLLSRDADPEISRARCGCRPSPPSSPHRFSMNSAASPLRPPPTGVVLSDGDGGDSGSDDSGSGGDDGDVFSEPDDSDERDALWDKPTLVRSIEWLACSARFDI